jgi:predicted metal-dependent hydrolase
VLSLLRRSTQSAPQSLAFGAREVPLRVRQSARARRIALRIDAAASAIELVLPHRVPLAVGLDFIEQRRGWIAARLAAMPEHIAFADGAEVPVLGVAHRIRHLGLRRSEDGRIVSRIDGEIRVVGDPSHVARRVRDHLVGLARTELTERARALALRIERRVVRVTVRDTKSRWGSCSTSGNLAFSWRLILAPEPVLDYVVAHEVAHLVEMNHGVRFWRLVEWLAPGAAQQRAWLKKHRTRLLRYG